MADGAANRLKIYWLTGEGAAKIRWGTSGDFTRCVRELRKHVTAEQARRMCQTWHKEAVGYYTGDRRNR